MDLFTTIAKLAGGKVPSDRIIDGVDQTDFFLGKQEESNREGFVVYVGSDVYGVKWRNWKMMFKDIEHGTDPIKEYGFPRFIDLHTDMKEEYPVDDHRWNENAWVRYLRIT